MNDAESIARHYANASDEELREARRLGPDAFRPEAWVAIQSELGRRHLPRTPGHPRRARQAANAFVRQQAKWTPGLTVGAFVATGVTLAALVAMPFLIGGRRRLGVPIGLFLAVWFGTALLIDWRRWWPRGRR